jgi:hypothetical protein
MFGGDERYNHIKLDMFGGDERYNHIKLKRAEYKGTHLLIL